MVYKDGIKRERKVRLFTGPSIVNEIHNRAVAAGYTSLAGTEHVYVNLVDNGDGWGVLESVDKFCADVGVPGLTGNVCD